MASSARMSMCQKMKSFATNPLVVALGLLFILLLALFSYELETQNHILRQQIEKLRTEQAILAAAHSNDDDDAEYHQDSMDWNKPETYQWKNWGSRMGKPEPGPQQKAFDAQRSERHAELKPIFERLASSNNGTVVVMLVNAGQFPLLRNFGCAADARGIPWRDFTFVFTLDSEAQQWAVELNVSSYHPPNTEIHDAAQQFSDAQFQRVVFWKNAVVHDALELGVHDVLFQDVDVVWKQNPTPYFLEAPRRHIDAFFMNDGNSEYQQPIYINTGFMFMRNTARTRLLWLEAYLNGHTSNAQQSIVNPLVVHHYFVNNLRVFVLSDVFLNGDKFTTEANAKEVLPGGTWSGWMVAHSSWTRNASVKVDHLKWINEWYAQCVNGTGTL